ncbi:MAG: NAD(P)/FAD-dependent oxidoreductase [Bacteroidota bacterium]
MSSVSPKVVIIGAGVAGLIAAHHLEEAGLSPLVLEATDRPGGRLKSEKHEGFTLDRGFQVLLTGYEEVHRYLDVSALKLGHFRPGAHVHTRTQHFRFVDPLREPAQLIRTTLSPIGVLRDKTRLARLNLKLRRKTPEQCYKGYEEKPTIDYLRDLGFSEQIIERFFRPFFGGIFLEQGLQTPAAQFRFVFKMFGSGSAAIPAEGIEAIPQQLAAKLNRTEIRLHTRVVKVENDKVILDDGSPLLAKAIIIACPPSNLVSGLGNQPLEWKATTNLYYYSSRRLRENRLINLVFDPTSTINTFCVLDEVAPHYKGGKKGGSLISITLKEALTAEESIAQSEQDLLWRSKLPSDALTFLKRYDIRHALPKLPHLLHSYDPTHSRLTEHIFLAGDHQLNGSLDAAMRSGRLAAQGVLAALV